MSSFHPNRSNRDQRGASLLECTVTLSLIFIAASAFIKDGGESVRGAFFATETQMRLADMCNSGGGSVTTVNPACDPTNTRGDFYYTEPPPEPGPDPRDERGV